MSFPWARHYQPTTAFGKYIDEKLPIPRLVYDSVGAGYPVPKNLNYFYNFGVLAGVALVVQIITGIVLAMHYAANTQIAFDSVEHIMRDVNGGWMLRYMHATGASFFFVAVYVHIFRGLYYGSYKPPREVLWLLGLVIFLLMMATAFMGYVLVWGQMSFWGATVITNLFSAIPLVGDVIHTWLLGGFAPDNATLNRFFSLHYLLPFVILGVVILHVWALHIPGSNNPTGISVKGPQDTVPFHPYYTAKDFFGLCVYLLIFAAVVFFAPNALGEPDNYIPANPLSTPALIVPEWYFWPFYAILRAFTVDFLFIPGEAVGRAGDVQRHPAAVLPALARHVAGQVEQLPADGADRVLGVRRRRRGARLLRRPARRPAVAGAEPDHRGLLFRALPDHPAADQPDREAAAAAQFDLGSGARAAHQPGRARGAAVAWCRRRRTAADRPRAAGRIRD